ncbi:MAG TPA: YihY family inner membrane protein, partial [Zeimonas sp.]
MSGTGMQQGEGGIGAAGDDSSGSVLRRIVRTARAMWRQATQLHLPQTAGSLAFLSLLAIAPMFSIVFWVTTASPMFGRLRDALQGFLMVNLFPSSISNTVIELLNQFAAKANELSVIGLTVFLLTAFVALQTIEGTLNRIWLADRRRSLAHRLAMYWMMLTLGPLLLGASLVFHGIVATSWLRGADLNEVRNVWYFVLPWVTSVAGLTLLYRLMPSAAVRWRDAFLGAMLAAFLFEFLRTMLGLYVTSLPTYTIVYGTFAALPLFLLWLFFGWMSVLIGALLAANLRFWSSSGEPHLARAPAARFADAHAVLAAMRRVLGPDPYTAMPVEQVVRALDGDPERAIEAAILLTRLGYITRFVKMGEPAGAGETPTTRRARVGQLARRWRRPRA